jgi:hypothetical protein
MADAGLRVVVVERALRRVKLSRDDCIVDQVSLPLLQLHNTSVGVERATTDGLGALTDSGMVSAVCHVSVGTRQQTSEVLGPINGTRGAERNAAVPNPGTRGVRTSAVSAHSGYVRKFRV